MSEDGGLSEEAKQEFIQKVKESGKFGFRTPSADKFKGRDIIILAMGPSRGYCPFDTETWGVNMSHIIIYNMKGRLDKLFIGHNPNPYPTLYSVQDGLRRPSGNWGWDYIDGLAKMGVDVITLHRIKGVQSRLYPLKRLIKKFGTDYFTDTMCYMLAYAIDKKYDKIRIYGVDMADRQEFIWEKGGIEYWIGFARGLGIEVYIAPGSNLCKTKTRKPYVDGANEAMLPITSYGSRVKYDS